MEFAKNTAYGLHNRFHGMKVISDLEIAQTLHLPNECEELQLLMMKYECAMTEMITKLEVLSSEMSLKFQRNPFESIRCRLKSSQSIYDKLCSHGYEVSYQSIRDNLNDIAGVRVVCSFIDDIYLLASTLKMQDDLLVIQEKDYIIQPKNNGYRSLHLIVMVPIFLMKEKEYMKVEVQFRTIAMDFWASLDHQLKYKRADIADADAISEEMKISAELVSQLDNHMLQIRERIDAGEK